MNHFFLFIPTGVGIWACKSFAFIIEFTKASILLIRGSIGGASVGNVGGPVFVVVDGMAF